MSKNSTPRDNASTSLTSTLHPDVRASHITTITELGRAVSTVGAASDIAEAVFNAMPDTYDWTAKHGKSTALTVAVHVWATGTDDTAAWPQMTRPSGEADGKRVRTHYAVGVDAIAKHLRKLAGTASAKETDWLGLAVSAAMNASNNGVDLSVIVHAIVNALPETGDDDAAMAEAVVEVIRTRTVLALAV
jgi:hypothetical protein